MSKDIITEQSSAPATRVTASAKKEWADSLTGQDYPSWLEVQKSMGYYWSAEDTLEEATQ